jgi:hypothetical protein
MSIAAKEKAEEHTWSHSSVQCSTDVGLSGGIFDLITTKNQKVLLIPDKGEGGRCGSPFGVFGTVSLPSWEEIS